MRLHLRLPWNKKSEPDQREPEPESLKEAVAAERVAKRAVAEARAREPEVQRLVHRIRQLQEDNHVGERVAKALRDGYGGGGEAHGH